MKSNENSMFSFESTSIGSVAPSDYEDNEDNASEMESLNEEAN